jgi:hypothetical protein
MQPASRISALLLGLAGCLVGIGLSSCASRPPSAPPPVLRKVAPESAAATRSKIGQAEQLEAVGDYEAALDVLRGALARAGDVGLREEIQLKRLRLKRRALGRVLLARVGIPRDRIIAGSPLRVAFALTNRGNVSVTIPAIDYEKRLFLFKNPVGRTVIEARVTLDEFDPRYTTMREVFTRFVEPERDVVIEPGETWYELLDLDSTKLRPQTLLLKRLRVDGVMRPVRVRIGDRDLFTSIEFEPGELFVLPPGAEAMVGDPVEHLRLAIFRAPHEPRFLPHVLVAASMVRKPAARAKALHLLKAAEAQGDPSVRPSATRALELFWPEAEESVLPASPTVEFKPVQGQ